jgi:geranylgeranyl transferase type-2 subunit beta
MNPPTYLDRLAIELLRGLATLPEDVRQRHLGFLLAAQNPDGGFSGREGPSDLYYTGFALRSLAILGSLTPSVAERVAGFLRSVLQRQASVVDFFSFLYACRLIQSAGGPDVLSETTTGWQDRTTHELATFRTPDGGYAKTPGSPSGSTYHTFLVALCHELIGRPLPTPKGVQSFIASRQREDGGYVEIAAMKRSGTNPTAAAVGTLKILGMLSSSDGRTIDFLSNMLAPEGGLRANARAPLADLLSTFTGLWTLKELDAIDRLDRGPVRAYVDQLERPGGGFVGGLWDACVDVEYTFYGLGTWALVRNDA